MKIMLDVFENSKDFLFDSVDLYSQGYSDDNHENPKSIVLLRRKWKLAYIVLVQAIELILKHAISTVSPNLLMPNIDAKPIIDKTITFEQCIARTINFTEVSLDDDIEKLRSSARLRNQLVHYKVDISTQEIQAKYASALTLYCNLYEKITNKKVEWLNSSQQTVATNLFYFESKMEIRRGVEIPKTDRERFEKDIELAQKHRFFINKEGETKERIRFGDEGNYGEESLLYGWPYCDDCVAKQGEYHLQGCDLEVCPFCFGQALACDCVVRWHNLKDEP